MLDNISNKRQIIVVAALLGIIIFWGGAKYYEMRLHTVKIDTDRIEAEVTIEEKEEAPETGDTVAESPRMLTVHVVGAVENPGVYSFEEGKRVNDAVQLAVPAAKADLTQINLAAPLEDAKQIYVPAKGEKPSFAVSTHRLGAQNSGLVNINTAPAGDLEKLPGIGPALAGRIIEYRENKGSFKSVEEITKVSGIGPALLEKIRNRITVD